MISKMRSRRPSSVAALLPRIPVAALGVVIAVSALQASCSGETDMGPLDNLLDGGRDADGASPPDAPSEDSREDRADGMSYGDGYGKEDARAASDAHEPDDGSCVTSAVTYPPAPGCPEGNHTWACWKPTPVVGGVPDSSYTLLKLCGDGVAIDKNTHLMWAREEEVGTYTWVTAASACTSSRRAGFSDWRLPSSNELMSLVDYSRSSTPVFNPDVFSFNGAANAAMWSSTVFVQQAGSAWQLYGSGGIYPQVVSDAAAVRCVR